MPNDMPSGLNISSNDPNKPQNGNGSNMLDQLVAAFAEMDDTHINAVVQALLPAILRYDLIAPRVWGDAAKLSIPDNVNIYDAFFDTSGGKITIENDCSIGHRCKFITSGNDSDITIKKGAVIETGATIVGPCTVNEGACIKAGAVVTGDNVPKSETWSGNPAQKV